MFFTGRFYEHSLVFFLDDKASIPVGFEGAPVSATRRQRKILMAGVDERGLNAMDHDNIPQHIVPSVTIKLLPPQTLNDSWYGGKPTIILKDAIFEPSTAFRHAAELIKNMTLVDYKKPMIFFGTDGGPDHNVTSIQVILSYLAIFLELDLDFLVAVRTPPNFSVINPAERFMSVANIGLIGVALARNHLGENEKRVKSLMSKKQWRDAQERHPEINYRKLALDGTKDARQLLSERFKRLTYKGEKVTVGQSASIEEINQLREPIVAHWPDIDFSKTLVKSDVMNLPSMKNFIVDHARFTRYAVQFRKCQNSSCTYHKRIRSEPDIFESIKWLPSPELIGEKYSDFEDVFGNEPTNKDVPSLQPKKTDEHNKPAKPPFPLAHTRARYIVRCTECNFPRLLYSKYSLDKKQLTQIDLYFEEKLYVCGSTLDQFPDLFQNMKLNCNDPISLHYFQSGSTLAGYYAQCAKCLRDSVPHSPNKLLLCTSCTEQTPKAAKIFKKRGRGRPCKQ